MKIPEFDEMYSVSDLHMGGPEGFQILRDTKRLAAFIRQVAGQRPDDRVALVLNGDVIDTLAEDCGGYIATVNAGDVVKRIMDDKAFEQVWDALSDFVGTDNRTLVIVIGNHDLELSFPAVQELISDRIAGQDAWQRGRIVFSTTGAGFTCMVGTARVFCTHGNEVDSWNYNRYEDLSKLVRRMNAGKKMASGEWEPNAGTKMVKDVMNEVKRRYPWIDLLKPEMTAAVGVLLALDPGQVEKINKLLPVIGEKVKSTGDVDRRLSDDGFAPASREKAGYVPVDDLLGANLKQGLAKGRDLNGGLADAMFAEAEKEYKFGNATTETHDDTLGTAGYVWDRITGWIRGISKAEALRRALLDWLKDDPTFVIDDEDDTCKDIVRSVGSGIDFIVTGHTHLDRAIDLGGGRYYFNCGTWIRLLRFTDKILADETAFEPVYKLLKDGSMKAIDAARFEGAPFVLDRSSAVCIKTAGSRTIGQLLHIKDKGDEITTELVKEFKK